MGRVFLGQSPGGRPVAVKLIRAELARDPEFRARFEREVVAARRVSGIFTSPVVDADPDGPQPWLVTAYVNGPSLADAVAGQGPLPVASVLTLAAGLAEGLGAIHAAGVVHRDLKPSNVLLAGDGPRIIDFGISRALDATALTQAGGVLGSPEFMSPEQALGRQAGPASDIFSLGAVVTYAATGHGPFGAASLVDAMLYRVVYDPPATADLPTRIRPWVERCLAKDPLQRPTTDQILADLGTVSLASRWLPWPASQAHVRADPTRPWPPGAAATALPAPGELADAPTLRAATVDDPPGGSSISLTPGQIARPARSSAVGRPPPSSPRRRRAWRWACGALAAALTVTTITVALLASGGSQSAPPASPRAVVQAYFVAINKHDLLKVWQLEGKYQGQTYNEMVAGYRTTVRDQVTSLQTRGNTVTVHFQAYHPHHVVQVYKASYTVRAGVIPIAKVTWLGTRHQ